MQPEKTAKRVLELFKEISAIPRPSHAEASVAKYICAFAKAHGHEVYTDELHNVLVNVKATPGAEEREPILLQAHTDMVCEKNGDSTHDFARDPLTLVEENGMLRACGTSLGADDGVGVAIMLLVIEGGVSVHGDIQCLFTTAEETGLFGAKGFDYSKIYAKRMLNLDGGNENSIVVGCAGGVRSDILFSPVFIPTEGEVLRISLGGLLGGHSGEDIDRGRANANLLLGRLLSSLYSSVGLALISIRGGAKENAIPREAEATVAVFDKAEAVRLCEAYERAVKEELSREDGGFFVRVTPCETSEAPTMMDPRTTRGILAFLAATKNGVLEMSKKIPSLVEFSKNLGVIKTNEHGVVLSISSRSAIERQLDASTEEIDILAALCGAMTQHHSRYPGWNYTGDSQIADAYTTQMKALYSAEPQREIIHAGLECGIIKGALPAMDAISLGPTMQNIHSASEVLDIASFGRVTNAVLSLLSKK